MQAEHAQTCMGNERATPPPPLLMNIRENGLIYILKEALEVRSPTPKLRGSALAVAVATLEALWCWCESTIAYSVCALILRAAVTHLQGPRSGACEMKADGLDALAVVICAAARDWATVAAHAGAVTGMALWMSSRFSTFFGLSSWQLMAYMVPRGGLSPIACAACGVMLLGFIVQVFMQQVLGQNKYSLENLLEPSLGLSALRSSELFLLAPVREEVIFRFFVLHVFRNRVNGAVASVLTGLSFGAIHLVNGMSLRYTTSFVQVQVLLSSLLGSFLCTRMLVTGRRQTTSEPLVLHITNNLVSAMFGSGTDIDFADSFVVFSLAQTLCIFGYLLYRDLEFLRLSSDR